MSIENLKKILESEKAWEVFKDSHEPIGQAGFYYKDNAEYFKYGHEAATNRLLPLLEKAVKMAEFYNGLYVFDESDDDSEQLHIDKPWRYSSGKRAREFLSYFTKMTEIKKESV